MYRVPIVVMIVAVVLLGVAGIGIQPTAGIDAATPGAEGTGFVGSWRVAVSPEQGPPEVSFGTFNAEGTLVTAVSPVLPAPPDAPSPVVFTSAGHGAWEETGADTARITFVLLTADAQGTPLGTATVRGHLTLSADAQSFRGEVVRTLTDPTGTTLMTGPAMVEGTRILAEAPELAAAGTPAVATPST